MSERQPSGSSINAHISAGGDISGQVAVGEGISQTHQQVGSTQTAVTETDLSALRQMFETLRTQVATDAPSDKKASALERLKELEDAVTSETPNLTTMEYVKQWFATHLPTLSGAVTSVVIHPIVGKIVEAAGDVLAADFRHRFNGN